MIEQFPYGSQSGAAADARGNPHANAAFVGPWQSSASEQTEATPGDNQFDQLALHEQALANEQRVVSGGGYQADDADEARAEGEGDDSRPPGDAYRQQPMIMARQTVSTGQTGAPDESRETGAPEPPSESQMPDSIESLMGADLSGDLDENGESSS